MSSVGREQVRLLNITVSSGSGTGTITPIWTHANWVRVIPPSESATYDVTFLDGDGDIMVKRTGQTGTMAEMLELSLGILSSVQVANGDQDGTYKVKLDCN